MAPEALKDLRRPLPIDPSVEEVERGLGLVERHHVAAGVQAHKRKVAVALDLARLAARAAELEVLEGQRRKLLLAGPLERLAPGLVAEPVADEVGVTLMEMLAHVLVSCERNLRRRSRRESARECQGRGGGRAASSHPGTRSCG